MTGSDHYLSNRLQYVEVGGSSILLPTVCGVPEGSILGRLLFLLHVCELPVCVLIC